MFDFLHKENQDVAPEKKIGDLRLGKAPAKGDERLLLFANYLAPRKAAPLKFDYWKKRAPFPLRSFGNNQYGSCTISSQAVAMMRLERIEVKQTPRIEDKEIVRVYLNMTERLYGGGDTGAYELDALSNWRKPEFTFRDVKGRPLTIDAYTRVNQLNHEEVRFAISMLPAHLIKLCFNLPVAWSRSLQLWDLPTGQETVADYRPGGWGGHSMVSDGRYDEKGLWVLHTWNEPAVFVTWKALSVYCDEMYSVIDSIDFWRKQKLSKDLDLMRIKKDVNERSSFKIV